MRIAGISVCEPLMHLLQASKSVTQVPRLVGLPHVLMLQAQLRQEKCHTHAQHC